MKERVCVLMATYNPQKYLLEQINSILQQEKVEVEIIIRDDGSINPSVYMDHDGSYRGLIVL